MIISTDDYNQRVKAAARTQHLPSTHTPSDGSFIHRWKVDVDRAETKTEKGLDFGINPLTGRPFFSDSVFQHPAQSNVNRVWTVTVGPGCVNEEQACIEYLAQNDPRGWQMPDNYVPYLALQKVFGKTYPFVDRRMWESDRPVLLVTAPSPDGTDLGGFVKTPDHRRPEWFRTEEAWKRELYQASVLVTITPYKADPASLSLAVRGPRARRWRVMVGQVPSGVGAGVTGIATCELARLWLLRTPGKPQEDEIEVQQLVFWDLAARSIIDIPFLELIGAATMAADLGLLALSLAGGSLGLSLAIGAIGVEAAVINLLLGNLQDIIAATSGVDFWTV